MTIWDSPGSCDQLVEGKNVKNVPEGDRDVMQIQTPFKDGSAFSGTERIADRLPACRMLLIV